MDGGSEGFIAGIIIGIAASVLSGVISYDSGRDGMREQAIAAGAACFIAKQDGGQSVFQWNCKAK